MVQCTAHRGVNYGARLWSDSLSSKPCTRISVQVTTWNNQSFLRSNPNQLAELPPLFCPSLSDFICFLELHYCSSLQLSLVPESGMSSESTFPYFLDRLWSLLHLIHSRLCCWICSGFWLTPQVQHLAVLPLLSLLFCPAAQNETIWLKPCPIPLAGGETYYQAVPEPPLKGCRHSLVVCWCHLASTVDVER